MKDAGCSHVPGGDSPLMKLQYQRPHDGQHAENEAVITYSWPSVLLVAEKLFVYLLHVQGFGDSNTNVVSQHERCELSTIDKHHLEGVALCELVCRFCEVRGGDENALAGFVSAKAAAECAHFGFAD
jgi:hypothetical protein